MPLYEYKCKNCGLKFDMFKHINECDKTVECKACHKMEASRTISTFFAQSGGNSITPSSSGCSGCHGHSCSSCNH